VIAPFDLLRAAARVPLDAAAREAIRGLGVGMDWSRLRERAVRHRLAPLLYRHLSAQPGLCPPAEMDRLGRDALAIQARDLALAGEAVRIAAALDSAGIPNLAVKGPAAAVSYYGEVGLRQFRDVDVLVAPRDALRAWPVIEGLGFASDQPYRPGFRELIVRTTHEQQFNGPADDLMCDLHWDLLPSDLSFSLGFDEVVGRAETVAVGSHGLRTLGPADALLFFCLHGAKHDWPTLAAVCDVAQVARARPDLDWDRVRAWSRVRGRNRIVRLGLQLATTLLEAPIPAEVMAGDTDSHLAHLARTVEDRLRTLGEFPDEERSTWARTWGSVFRRSMERRSDQWRYFRQVALQPAPADWQTVPLPASLWPLFFVVRGARLVLKHSRAHLMGARK
jgi:hypothetical protein